MSEEGPAVLLVPSEAVRLLPVELPLASRARRLEALPFAIEDRIAEPVDQVHLALGIETQPRTYLVAVVNRQRMAAWVAAAEAAGLGHAAMLPDALALPPADAGEWVVQVQGRRALVRDGDHAGFAIGVDLLEATWDAAGRPPLRAFGDGLPRAMAAAAVALHPAPLAARVAAPAIDLRQGGFARADAGPRAWLRPAAGIVGAGIAAHLLIFLADTVMLGVVAERRRAETAALFALAAPGQAVPAGELADAVLDRLAAAGGGTGTGLRDRFLPVLSRVSAALAPITPAITVRRMAFDGTALVIDIAPADPDQQRRIRAALAAAVPTAQVSAAPDGAITLRATA